MDETLALDTTYNPLPGVDALGRCINIYEKYDVPSRPQLFDFNKPGKMTYEWSGITYYLPGNVSNPTVVSGGQARAEFFSSREAFSRFFSERASVEGAYRAFSAQFSEAFSVNSETETEYNFGLLHTEYDGYQVTVDVASPKTLRDEIRQDPLYMDVPSEYRDDNKADFFRFFNRYGTHYISAVIVGGRLYSYSKIEKSYNFTEAEIKANLSAEYNALFQAKASVEVAWKQVDKHWFTSQSGYIEFRGGDRAILGTVVPAQGKDLSEAYGEWLDSLAQYPAPRDFTLRPISDIFPNNKQVAVAKAMEVYANSHLVVEAIGGETPQSSSGYIALNGVPYYPSPIEHGWGGLLVTVFDRTTLKLLQHGTYDVQKGRMRADTYANNEIYAEAAYRDAVQALQPYAGRSDVIIALVFWAVNSLFSSPPAEFLSFMRSLGADDGLNVWGKHKTSGTAEDIAYALVGIPDSGHLGLEYINQGHRTSDYPAGPFPDLRMEVFLEPEATIDGQKILVHFTPR